MEKSLSEAEFSELYEQVRELVDTFLPEDVKMPKKDIAGRPSKDAIVLCVLFKYMGQPVSKSDLTEIMRTFFPVVKDVQQGRHLAKQKGFWIESGRRGHEGLRADEYQLVSLHDTYPGWNGRRTPYSGDFIALKAEYGFRCATCGSKEGEPQFSNSTVTTTLQLGHMDPRVRALEGNAIPQCGECNRAYRDWFIFDANGRVRDINPEADRTWGSTS
jgi:hypothetical protein